jgi:hypothetical protein
MATPERTTVEELINSIKSGERPLDQHLGSSLGQLYTSGQYGEAVVKPAGQLAGQPQYLEAIRLITLRNDRLTSSLLYLPSKSQKQSQILSDMQRETRSLPGDVSALRVLEQDALKKLRERDLLVAAAMQFGESTRSRTRIISVAYPKMYMDLLSEFFSMMGASMPEKYKRDSALGLSLYFLKSMPLGQTPINLKIPSH